MAPFVVGSSRAEGAHLFDQGYRLSSEEKEASYRFLLGLKGIENDHLIRRKYGSVVLSDHGGAILRVLFGFNYNL